MSLNPLILTLSLNPEAAVYFTNLRTLHFPAERNYLQAHLTLFHKLPPEQEEIYAAIEEVCLQQQPLQLQVTGIMSLGNGVAFKLDSEELQRLHKQLQHKWQKYLSPQDKQKLRPHITIQNKVQPEVAKKLEQELQQKFTQFSITGTGLTLWEYLGGPWKQQSSWAFAE